MEETHLDSPPFFTPQRVHKSPWDALDQRAASASVPLTGATRDTSNQALALTGAPKE